MKVFSGSSNRPLAEKVAQNLGLKLSSLEIHKFPDGEKRVRVVGSDLEDDVVLVQSTGIPVDENYMELFLILDALKRSGARSITLVSPYFGYQRQDHMFREGEDVSFKVIVQMLESLKVDKVITFDLHSIKIPEFFHIPVVHLTVLDLFVGKIDKDSVLVSPDMGGIRRIKYLSEKTGLSFATIEKNRDLKTGRVQSEKIEGSVQNKNVAIVDDMISTGETIRAAVELLKKECAEKINVFATHAVFADDASSILDNLDVEKVYVTDTIEVPKEKQFEKLEIISVANLIVKELR